MRKILFILLLAPFALKSQTVNTFRDSTWFKRGVRFDSTLVFSKGAGVGKVWTSNANGTGSWQTFSSAGVTQGALDDSISDVRAIRKVDTIYKSLDSIVFKINGIRYAVLDSTGGGVPNLQQVTDVSPVTSNSLYVIAGNTKSISITSSEDIENDIGMYIDENGVPYFRLLNPTRAGGKIKSDNIVSDGISEIINTFQLPFIGGDGAEATLPISVNGILADNTGTISLPLITSDSLAQIRQEISDTATQIRSEIPNVSGFATITNLADTSTALRSLISAKVSTTTLTDSLEKKTNKLISFNTYTTSDTLRLSDADKVIEMNVGTANNLVIPNYSDYAFPVGTQITVIQIGAGQTTFSPASGVTVTSESSKLKLSGVGAMATLIKRSTNAWYLGGSLTN